jgi:pimeloyl-ACP methyl ester carboxylesterase
MMSGGREVGVKSARERLGWRAAVVVASLLGSAVSAFPAEGSRLFEGSSTFEVDGRRIHYEVHGQGPVLMTVPNSWGLSLEGLRGMYRLLEERLTLVYFDPRGMGGSSPVREESDRSMAAVREDFEALRAHLGLGKVAAIGWSNGAMNLILLAHDQAEGLSAAVFVHTVARFTPEDGRAIAAEHPDFVEKVVAFRKEIADPALTAEEANARQRSWWLDEYFPILFADRASAPAKLKAAFGNASFSAAHARFANAETPTFDYREDLAAVPVRSLVVAGAHDLLPPERVKEVADALPDATFLVFLKSGHFAPLEEPQRFRNAVFDFLGVTGSGE